MNDDPRTAPLREWNRLAQENAENAIVSSMFEAATVASEPIDTFSTWLLLGSAAIGGFVISNADKLVPLISRQGFLVAGVLLCLSCVFGVLAKVFALRMKIMVEAGKRVRSTFEAQLASYREEEEKIQEGAKFWGINLQSGIRMDRVLAEFYKPLPWWVRRLATRHLKKHKGDPQVGHIPGVRTLNAQALAAGVQVLLFIAFLGTCFIWASAA